MLLEFLDKAVAIGADRVEIEYKDDLEWIYASDGIVGVGIGTIKANSAQSKQLFRELEALKKAKQAVLQGVLRQLSIKTFQSFGEDAHWISIKKPVKSRTPISPASESAQPSRKQLRRL